MNNHSSKIIIISSLILLLVAVLFLFFFDRTNYFLNKTVRLVSLRLIQFERLSFIRKEDYKFKFSVDHYDIFSFSHRTNTWHLFACHRYPDNITPSIKDFEFVLTRGNINHFRIHGKEIDLKSYLILNFYPSQETEKGKGVIFYKDGNWRALGL